MLRFTLTGRVTKVAQSTEGTVYVHIQADEQPPKVKKGDKVLPLAVAFNEGEIDFSKFGIGAKVEIKGYGYQCATTWTNPETGRDKDFFNHRVFGTHIQAKI